MMCEWSENDSSYLVNLLLGFSIAQSEDFQKYKAERPAISLPARNDTKQASDQTRRVGPSVSGMPAQTEKEIPA